MDGSAYTPGVWRTYRNEGRVWYQMNVELEGPQPSVETVGKREPRYPHPRNVYRTAWGTWYVIIQVDGERHYSGTRPTMEDAVAHRDWLLEEIRQSDERAASTDAVPQTR